MLLNKFQLHIIVSPINISISTDIRREFKIIDIYGKYISKLYILMGCGCNQKKNLPQVPLKKDKPATNNQDAVAILKNNVFADNQLLSTEKPPVDKPTPIQTTKPRKGIRRIRLRRAPVRRPRFIRRRW